MANPQEELKQQQAIVNEIKQQLQLYNELMAKKKEISQWDSRAKSALNEQINQWKDVNRSIDRVKKDLVEAEAELKSLSKEASKATKALEDQVKASENLADNFSELDAFQRSITRRYGEQSDETKRLNKNVDAIKAATGGIGKFLKKNVNLEEDQRDALIEASEYLKTMPSSFDKLNRQVNRGSLNQKNYNKYVAELNDNWEEILDKIDDSDKSLRGLKKSLKGFGYGAGLSGAAQMEYERLVKSEEKQRESSAVNSAIFGQLPGGEGINQLIEARHYEKQTPGSSTAKLKRSLGFIALGVAVADLASSMRAYIKPLSTFLNSVSNYYAPQLAEAQGNVNIEQAKFNRNAKLFGGPLAKKYGTGMFYVAEATKDFSFQMKDLANEFNKVSKTAFFGRGIGSVRYNASQLQLAGVGAESVASALTDIASGANVNFFGSKEGLGAQAAVFSKQMGISTSSVAQIMAAFRRVDGSSGKTALNMVYTSAKMADIAKLNPAVILQDMAEASGKMLRYNIQNAQAFAQQAISVRQMGGNLPRFAEGIRGSIINYKESLQSQIALSNILNRPVDFSVAQSLAYQGKYAEAYQNIQQSGVLQAVRKGGMIAENEFSKIFGMGLDEFQARAQGGTSIGLKGTMDAENKSFLQRVSGAELGFQIKAAQIRFDKAIIDEEFAKTLAVGLNKNPEYLLAINRLNDLLAASQKANSLLNTILPIILGALGYGASTLFKGKTPPTTPTTKPGGAKPTASGIPAGNNFAGYKMTGTGPNAMLQRPNGEFATKAERAAVDKAVKMGKLGKIGKFAGKGLGFVGAGLDVYDRMANQKQSVGQTAAGVGGGMAGAWALTSALSPAIASIAAATGPFAPLTAGVLGLGVGTAGYFGGSKIADSLTGVGKPKVAEQTQQVQESLDSTTQLLTAVKNIELLIIDIARYQATPAVVQMVMDGKDISNSLIRHQQNTRGQVKQTTLRQSLGWYK